jgi:hypothetical protein
MNAIPTSEQRIALPSFSSGEFDNPNSKITKGRSKFMNIRRLVVMFVVMAGLCFVIGAGMTWAQAPLPIGAVTGVTPLTQCPAGDGYASGTSCFSATVSCPNTVALGFTFGEYGSDTNGVIVIFNGGPGDQGVGGADFATDYVAGGFEVVQVVWNSPWELTGNGTGSSIKFAGCRPATVLKYISTNVYTTGGMCAQGASAGSGAVGYALAEYGAGSYLNNVELLSGPVFGDIEKGCVVPNTPTVTVCSSSQTYCQTGGEGGWPDPPQYVGGDQTSIDNWSGINGCNGTTNTTGSQNAGWKRMSIVDGLSDSTFSYPQTSMAGWLCSNTSVNCGPGTQYPLCQNNSAAEGQYFYNAVTGAQSFVVYRVDGCDGPEGVQGGTVPALGGESGFTAIEKDMVNKCKAAN